MPIFYFKCTDAKCPGTARHIFTPTAYKLKGPGPVTAPPCCVCGKPMKRAPKAATSRVTETLDNGLMSRRIERPADAERLYKERAAADNDRVKNPKL